MENQTTTPVVATNVTPKSKKSIFRSIIVGLFVFVIIFFSFSLFKKSEDKDKLEETLNLYVVQANKELPMMLDAETSWDKAELIESKTMQFTYTLVNYAKDDIDLDVFESTMKSTILSNVKNSTELQALRDKDVQFNYKYMDNMGKEVLVIQIKPADYK